MLGLRLCPLAGFRKTIFVKDKVLSRATFDRGYTAQREFMQFLVFRLKHAFTNTIKIRNLHTKPRLQRDSAIHNRFHKKCSSPPIIVQISFAATKMIEQREESLVAILAPPIYFLIYHTLVLLVTSVSMVVMVLNFCRLPLKYIASRSPQPSYSATEYLLELMGDEEELDLEEEEPTFTYIRKSLSWPSTPNENDMQHLLPSLPRPMTSIRKNVPWSSTRRAENSSENGKQQLRPSLTRSTRSHSPGESSTRRRMSRRATWSAPSKNWLARNSVISERIKTITKNKASFDQRKLFKRSRSIAERIKIECSRQGILRYRSSSSLDTI